jgi:hypothetical protein
MEHNLYRLRPHKGVGIMKYLCLAFVIGWSGAAYAATGTSPPVNVPITISSSGLTPPTEAANAGFTTLAANYDFSQPLYAVQSNWLDCVGNNASVPWHKGAPGVISNVPCNINQAVDPSGGQTVMALKYLNSYSSYANSGLGNYVSMQTVTNGGANQGGTTTPSFPNMYVEAVYRIDNVSSTGASGNDGVWDWQTTPGSSAGAIEFDFGELYGNNAGDSGTGNWGNAHAGGFIWTSWSTPCGSRNCNLYVPSGWSADTYHKYGGLITSDGATAVWNCAFIDDVLQQCVNPSALSSQYFNREWLIAWVGSNTAGFYPPDTNLYIQYIRVWSCANWVSQMCNGPSLSNSGGANPLIYWH